MICTTLINTQTDSIPLAQPAELKTWGKRQILPMYCIGN